LAAGIRRGTSNLGLSKKGLPFFVDLNGGWAANATSVIVDVGFDGKVQKHAMQVGEEGVVVLHHLLLLFFSCCDVVFDKRVRTYHPVLLATHDLFHVQPICIGWALQSFGLKVHNGDIPLDIFLDGVSFWEASKLDVR